MTVLGIFDAKTSMNCQSWGYIRGRSGQFCKQGSIIKQRKQLPNFEPIAAKNKLRTKNGIIVRSCSDQNAENPMLKKIAEIFLKKYVKAQNDVREYQDLYYTVQNLFDKYEPQFSGSNFSGNFKEKLSQDLQNIDSEHRQKIVKQIFEFLKRNGFENFDENFDEEVDSKIRFKSLNESQNIVEENDSGFEGDEITEERFKKLEIFDKKMETYINFLKQLQNDENSSSSQSTEILEDQKNQMNEFSDSKEKLLSNKVESKLDEILTLLREKKDNNEDFKGQLNQISENINQIKNNFQNFEISKNSEQKIDSVDAKIFEKSPFYSSDLLELNLESVEPSFAGKDSEFRIILKTISEVNPTYMQMLIPSFSGQQLQKILSGRNDEKRVIYKVFQSVIERSGQELERMVISDVQNGVYVSYLQFRSETGKVWFVGARPSDALNVALLFKAPIYVDKSVLKR
eukprot:TRINITY_DN983_c0_g1_i2.p1 TRINITY_DN983_c0_g1~~TRINITY_DN983_c0_g1_i2.p1  ORF type:complete len:475 (-),score=76.06 TRINITY_DN983_c0_g1_i2:456-1826(-)